MSKRPAIKPGKATSISGHPKRRGLKPFPRGNRPDSPPPFSLSYIDVLDKILSKNPPVSTDGPPYTTLEFLCNLLMGENEVPNLAAADALRDLNNRFVNSEYHDNISQLLGLFGKLQSKNGQGKPLEDDVDTPQPVTPSEHHPKFLASILAAAPKDSSYIELSGALDGLNHDFHREMASRLEPALNAHIQAMPHDTYEEKKTVAKWVNEELRRFDLAIKCPKTDEPSILLVGVGNHPDIGRFILEHKTPEGKRVRTVHTPDLPRLELMEANPRREALVEWRDKVGGQRGGAARD